MPTAYCNMTCSYCGQEHRKGSVQSDLVEKTIARVTSAFAAPSSKRVHVVWFGGEPLLGLRVLREMSSAFLWASQRYGKSYGASVVTNGSLLSDRTLQTLVEECHVRSIEVTLDGPAAIHDSRRTKRNGTGSFRKIVRLLSSTVREAKWPSLRLGIRVNIDRENEAHVSELIADLACYGFGHPRVELHLAPVHSWGNDVSAVEMEAKMYSQRECEWLRQAHDLGIDAVLLPTVPVQTTCLATSTFGELIDPGGGVYSCSEHPLVPRDKDKGLIATLDSLGSTARRPPGQFDGWYGEVRSGSWPCAQCPFLPVCGGSCPKQWHEGGLPCPSFKFGWESRLDIAAERMGLTVDA
ncbi:radical SAM protein [Nonomuraea sp. NPDC050536]|uniref:radical SAM protein n=1 Tax=Nonomuraea sp. NPDC050536 TaxID=3364366 RepID=UPI0037C64902